MIVDLHIHSLLSDGCYSFQRIVTEAYKRNLDMIAITDHDIIRDYSDETTLPIINGIEFNTDFPSKMHILGYGIKNIELLDEYTKCLVSDNEKVCIEVIRLLNNDGFDITYHDVMKYFNKDGVCNEYLTKKMIVRYLFYKGYIDNVHDGYSLLIGKGKKYYVPIKKINYLECLHVIKITGGVSILAHPFTLKYSDEDLFELLKELKKHGLDGIEVVNGSNRDKKDLYLDYANKLDLLTTFGSDFHTGSFDDIGVEVKEENIKKFIKKVGVSNVKHK